jgi:YfiH family protein
MIESSTRKHKFVDMELNGIRLQFSPLLADIDNLTHAFTTRIGGESKAPLDSFNLGRHYQDEDSRQDALKNRQDLCDVLKVNFERLCVPSQVHSANVTWLQEPQCPLNTDGLATSRVDLPLLTQFADCVPILLYDTHSKTIANIHAGWRGTANGIVTKAVELICDRQMSRPDHILAAIGPAIDICCYKIKSDVADPLRQSILNSRKDKSGDLIANAMIIANEDHFHADLKLINAFQLINCGLKAISISNQCTSCSTNIFYSHRATGGKTGRQGAIISLKKPIF